MLLGDQSFHRMNKCVIGSRFCVYIFRIKIACMHMYMYFVKWLIKVHNINSEIYMRLFNKPTNFIGLISEDIQLIICSGIHGAEKHLVDIVVFLYLLWECGVFHVNLASTQWIVSFFKFCIYPIDKMRSADSISNYQRLKFSLQPK